MPAREAIRESVRTRIRPIMMSNVTSVCGTLPLVLFGAGSELYRGLGSVVKGGLSVSTVFTLFVVPTLFHVVLAAKTALGRQEHRYPHAIENKIYIGK
jgi:HAE1 family hydrophobic/amphiphilic exporter-1